MLPYEPETFASVFHRLPEALKPVYVPEDFKEGDVRPGEQRRHVFDFHDGTRLIVSRDIIGGRTQVHVSASIHPQHPSYKATLNLASFCLRVKALWRDLSNGKKLKLVVVTEGKGIPHFIEE